MTESSITDHFLSDLLQKGEIPNFGEPHEFLRRYADESALQNDPASQKIHQALIAKSSVCSFCGVGCPYTKVKSKKGVERLIPLSPLGLCVKGSSSLLSGGFQHRKKRLEKKGLENDRITTPMIRGHNGKLVPVSWDRALDRAAWLFLHCREWVGPESIAIYGNGQKTIEAIWMASLYKLAFKTATIGANSEHCLASAGAAHTLNFGNEASFTWREFEELELADVIVLHGTNPVITFPQAHAKVKRNTKAIKVVIDPIRSDTVTDLMEVDDRTLHIRFEQGGDVLFNLAVARIVFENGWENQAYLDRNVEQESLETFKKLVFEDRCRPDKVAEEIVLEEDNPKDLEKIIHQYAELFAKPDANGERPRPAIISSMGINQSTGSYGFSTNLNLLVLTGNVGRKGAGSLRVAGQSNATSELMMGFNSRHLIFNLDPKNETHRQEIAKVFDIPVRNIADDYGTPVSHMADNDLLYCFIFIGTQFTKNMPRLGHWMRRLGRSFNIVIDSFMQEGVADYADVVFPSLTYTERTGVIQRGDRSFQLQQSITEPPELAWSDEQILAKLAMKIAQRLENPDTAALNDLAPTDIRSVFGKYIGENEKVDGAAVFKHIAEVSQQLDVYCRMEDANGELITHEMLKKNAGTGVQWQGNGRYQDSQEKATGFPLLKNGKKGNAKLVCPPEELLKRLVTKGNDNLRSLISGRGRPGRNRKHYIARYNSGTKTLPITGKGKQNYWIEVHPKYAEKMGLAANDPVRITSLHGTVISRISLNENVPVAFPFLDFVPGEVNRLTNYLDADKFTNQSLIKRTPIRMESLTDLEKTLWAKPDATAFKTIITTLYERCMEVYVDEEALTEFLRLNPELPDWLPWNMLRHPSTAKERTLAITIGATAAFLQQYMTNSYYQNDAGEMLKQLSAVEREQFLYILMPLLRKLDYSTAVIPLLTDFVGKVPMQDKNKVIQFANLKDAHQSAVLELKEEVVAIQLFLAVKTGLEILHGKGNIIERDSVALITGIAIPCAADVPAYYMGIAPYDIEKGRLIHGRIIGSNALVIVDSKTQRAVKIDTHTGILPKNRELMRLRNRVIGKKKGATPDEHRRFFDVLEELMVYFVRTGMNNFHVSEVFHIPWEEYQDKLSFVPANPKKFREYLKRTPISPALTQCLVDLDILKPGKDKELITHLIADGLNALPNWEKDAVSFEEIIGSTKLSAKEKVEQVIDNYIEPILNNDGGRIDLLGYDATSGIVEVRFVGSCANCPCSMLSLETIVIPPLMKIPGVKDVHHRTRVKDSELENMVRMPSIE